MISKYFKNQIKKLPAILDIREAADFFSVSWKTIRREILKKKLLAWKDDEGRWCITRIDLIKYCFTNSNL